MERTNKSFNWCFWIYKKVFLYPTLTSANRPENIARDFLFLRHVNLLRTSHSPVPSIRKGDQLMMILTALQKIYHHSCSNKLSKMIQLEIGAWLRKTWTCFVFGRKKNDFWNLQYLFAITEQETNSSLRFWSRSVWRSIRRLIGGFLKTYQ